MNNSAKFTQSILLFSSKFYLLLWPRNSIPTDCIFDIVSVNTPESAVMLGIVKRVNIFTPLAHLNDITDFKYFLSPFQIIRINIRVYKWICILRWMLNQRIQKFISIFLPVWLRIPEIRFGDICSTWRNLSVGSQSTSDGLVRK